MPARWEGIRHDSTAILVRWRRQGMTKFRLAPDQEAGVATLTPSDPAVARPEGSVALASHLADRPIMAPEALRRRQPFRRHIEESRPYLVLGEGMRMTNAHPIAVMVFWGGLTDWVLGAILVGHHVAGAVRLSIAVSVTAGWLLFTLARIGKLGELRESVRATRGLLADPATWASLELGGRSAFGRRLLARATGRLCFVRVPDRDLILAARSVPREALASGAVQAVVVRRADGYVSVLQGEEERL